MSNEITLERAGRFGQLPWLVASALVVGLDQWSKALIQHAFAYGEVRIVWPLFNLTHQHNTGAAFSFLDDQSGWQRWLFTGLAIAVSLLLLLWMRRLPRNARVLGAALGLIVGGAVGNLIDRLRLGYVVDFIQVHWADHYFPSFNVADSAITVGALLLLLDALYGARREPPGKRRPRPPGAAG